MEVDRFGKVEIEASFLASPDVFLFIKSSKGNSFDWLFSFGLSDHLVAAPVWQANVAQDNIELLRLDNFQRALRAIGHGNLVTKMIEQAGQYSQRVGVIFDDQNSQAPAPWRQSFCWIAAHWTWLARIFSGSLQQKSHRKWTLLSKQKSHVPIALNVLIGILFRE